MKNPGVNLSGITYYYVLDQLTLHWMLLNGFTASTSIHCESLFATSYHFPCALYHNHFFISSPRLIDPISYTYLLAMRHTCTGQVIRWKDLGGECAH